MLHAVVLYSVGSPEKADVESLKSFLKNFLSDKLVVRIPRFIWQPVLRSFILRSRPERMVSRYKQIFIEEHNPYLISMSRLAYRLECALNQNGNDPFDDEKFEIAQLNELQDHPQKENSTSPTTEKFVVRNAFAYAGKNLEKVVKECVELGAQKVTLIPLFPQYSDTTTKRPAMELAKIKQSYKEVEFAMVRSFPDDKEYIEAITESIKPMLNELLFSIKRKKDEVEDVNSIMKRGKAHVLITFHSLPQSYIKLGDPYLNEVEATTKALVASLGLDEENISIAYQSKMGPMSWLKPDIEDEVERLLDKGISRLLVVAPGFSIDCLETLYDIDINLRERFLSLGGDSFLYVPALNHSKSHIKLLSSLVRNNAKAL